jgi:hypothetical protein
MFRHDTRDDIAWAAGREWDNHRDGSSWIALRVCREQHAAQPKNGQGHQTGQPDHGTHLTLAPLLSDLTALVVVAGSAPEDACAYEEIVVVARSNEQALTSIDT